MRNPRYRQVAEFVTKKVAKAVEIDGRLFSTVALEMNLDTFFDMSVSMYSCLSTFSRPLFIHHCF